MAPDRDEQSNRCELDRRTLLRGAALAAPLVLAGQTATAAQPPAKGALPGLIMRQREPENLEFSFPTLDSFLVPTERFYVRSHFPTPRLDVKTWRLRVEGAVERPLALSYDEIRKLPPRSAPALLECAGNSRVFLVPRAPGVLWELGAVGVAEWTGIPLATILDRAGVRKGAVEVVLEGADTGAIRDAPSTPGTIHFARSLPLARARRPEVLLAHRMNGAELTPAHGYPLRAVVPGWYAMASIKWLTRIVVTDRPFQGYFQTLDYSYFERVHGLPSLTPITELQVKALIARPGLGEVVPAQQVYRVHGAAWTGDSEVTRVEVSTDAGKTWAAARLLDKPVPYAWRLWEYSWRTPAARGRHTLMARATDRRGHTQPLQRDPDRRNYLISHVLPVAVEVR